MSTPQVKSTLPNSVKADINKDIPYVPQEVPHTANYRSPTNAAEEQQYKIEKDAEKIIPVFEDCDSDTDEEDDNGKNNKAHVPVDFTRVAVYSKFDFKNRRVDASRLAVHEKKHHILSSLENSRVVIVEGFTGCGKTTQVPQYILDSCVQQGKICNIVVTQPRKIAAISVASRVCHERNWNLGSVVGYHVGLEAKVDKGDTLLTYMTTGVLLRKLLNEKSFKEYTHIIIDEVHERDVETDMLLLVIKQIMAADKRGVEKHVKLILMSATIETNKFEKYFIFKTTNDEKMYPRVIKIPFVARHQIKEYFLDDLCSGRKDDDKEGKKQKELFNKIQCNQNMSKASIPTEVFDVALNCIKNLDAFERKRNQDPRIRDKPGFVKERGSVLVFLPGIENIRQFQRVMNEDQINCKKNVTRDPNYYHWTILLLHSSINSEDQAKVFKAPEETFRKIILSTNIAESSVTVPDIAYVIDFCLTKSNCIDQSTNFTTLKMFWASKSQCVQRKGRTGRVADGVVYRLVTKKFYQNFSSQIEPEMKRCNLESVILMCKKFGGDTPKNLLREALDGPELSAIKRAICTLKELGALTITQKDKPFSHEDGDLTFLGQVLTDLPIQLQLTRLIMLGYAFGVMDEAIIIAAGLNVKSPFYSGSGWKQQMDAYMQKVELSQKSFSDLLALYHVYKFWKSNYGKGGESARRWAHGAMVHLGVFREVKATVDLIEDRLKKLGVTTGYTVKGPSSDKPSQMLDLSESQGFFFETIAGAFYPRYFLHRWPEPDKFERDATNKVIDHDPCRTVVFQRFPKENQGELYAKNVADQLSYGTNIPEVKFYGEKVLAIFKNDNPADKIGYFNKAMFRALKLRQLRQNVEFNVLRIDQEREEIRKRKTEKQEYAICPLLTTLPTVRETLVTVRIQYINHPWQFWVVFENNGNEIRKIESAIRDNMSGCGQLHPSKIVPNAICLAPFGGDFYRAKILRGLNEMGKCLVYFVDYGNSCMVEKKELRDFTPAMMEKGISEKPCLAVECRLSNLKPSRINAPNWSKEAIQIMQTFCGKIQKIHIKVYSIVESIITCELIGTDDREQQYSLNQILCSKTDANKKKYAEPAKESLKSQENHRKRLNACSLEEDVVRDFNKEQIADVVNLNFMEPPGHAKILVSLKGPYSPLEMADFQALVYSSKTKKVRVETISVNSVLLDHELTNPTSRMLVAADVDITEDGLAIVARSTTVMPTAVPDILGLVAMIFAPRIELRVNKDQSKYSGVLCGCGVVPGSSNTSVYPDNDMEITFDTEIDNDDIDKVNEIRNCMNLLLRESKDVNKNHHHKPLGIGIVKLLQKPRKEILRFSQKEPYVWNRISGTSLIPPNTDLSFGQEDIFQLHRKVQLKEVKDEEVEWTLGY